MLVHLVVLASLLVACHPPAPEGQHPGSPLNPDSGQGDSGTSPGPGEDSAAPEEVGDATLPAYEHLPVFLIDTLGNSINSDEKVDAWLEVVREHDGTLTDLDTAPRAFSGPIGIEYHGSSSLGYPKLNYRIECRDEDGEDRDVALLDLPAESDWVLHGPYPDKTYFRNVLAYALGRELAEEAGRWEPRTRFFELFLNDEYQGLYVLVERVKRDHDRLDLPRPAASAADGDLTGGYIFKIDQHRNEGFDTARGTRIDYVYPRVEDITPEQDAYLKSWLDDFETMLSSPGWNDPDTGYPAWIDVDSWVDHFIIEELSHNIDAYRLSAYLYKDADADGGLLHAGPLWDFDRAWGDVNYCDCWLTEGFIIDDLTRCGCGDQFPFWWEKLLSDPAFTERLRCRWEELRQGVLADDAIFALIEEWVEEVSEAEPRDHDYWGNLGVNVYPNYYVGETYRDEVDWLENWISERARWLDGNMPGSCDE